MTEANREAAAVVPVMPEPTVPEPKAHIPVSMVVRMYIGRSIEDGPGVIYGRRITDMCRRIIRRIITGRIHHTWCAVNEPRRAISRRAIVIPAASAPAVMVSLGR